MVMEADRPSVRKLNGLKFTGLTSDIAVETRKIAFTAATFAGAATGGTYGALQMFQKLGEGRP